MDENQNLNSKSTAKPKPELIGNFLSSEALTHASVGLLVTDVNSGKEILEYNSNKTLVPASAQKLLIAGAALEIFGSEHVFETKMFYTGKIDWQGTLQGDIIIRGGGDPALGSHRFKDHYPNLPDYFAQAIRDSGIKKIEGKIIGDASFFGDLEIPDTWIWEDIGNYYGAPANGLSVYENMYKLSFSSGKPGSLSKISTVDPEIPNLAFINQVRASKENRDNAWIFGSYLSEIREVKGTIPSNRKNFTIKGAIPDPAFLLASQLTENLQKSGIPISEDPISSYQSVPLISAQNILTIQSPPLSEIVYYLNMNSINLYAETLLLHLAKEKSGEASVELGCKALKVFWDKNGMDTQGLFLEDGSGLSRANSVTAGQLSFLLHHMKTESESSDVFIQSLPVAGKSGSLNSFGKGTSIEGKFAAKSGYMSRVMSYAGYLSKENGTELSVVVLVNNYTCSNSEMRKLLVDLVSGL
jgi:D-alanyl-D-alanine carboxypeptidase/D-alanyl-D-alanine-endopeptidase (penicillin-binding protein 4)